MPGKKYLYSIGKTREQTIKIRRSIFTCRLKSVDSIEEAKAFISSVSKANKTATHNCWAYILGDKGEIFHCSDAGEPAGTAGKPMLHTLQSRKMTRVAAVVTRIYGGVKLGVRGLIDAYAESVQAAIDTAPLKKLVKVAEYKVILPYDFNETFLARMGPFLHRVADTAYSQDIEHHIEIEDCNRARAEQMLNEYQARGKLVYSLKQ